MHRRLIRWLIATATLGAFATGAWAWGSWLKRRRMLWFGLLNDAIPVHAAWWREQRAEAGKLLYVAIGDSAAQGIGASQPSHSYVGQLARRLQDHTGATVSIVNLAVSGATVELALRDQVPPLRKLAPDILTVAIGANDVIGWDAERFERHYRALLEHLPEHAILADVPSFYILPGRRAVAEANPIIRRLAAERGLRVVDLYRRTARQSVWGMTRQFAGDLFHPNDRGYRVWADAFWPAVAERADAVLAQRSALLPEPRPEPVLVPDDGQYSRNGLSPSDFASPSSTDSR
jgi:lysophospholipase L1-like esterase